MSGSPKTPGPRGPEYVRRTCNDCRYWSQFVAQYGGGASTEGAMCLNQHSPYHQKFQTQWATCTNHAENTHGAWDEFGRVRPEELPAEYVAEEVRQRLDKTRSAPAQSDYTYAEAHQAKSRTRRKKP